MSKKTQIREHRWVLLQHKNGRYYIGVIKEKSSYNITIISIRNIVETFKNKNITIAEYKENLYILQLRDLINKYPHIDANVTNIVEGIKKHKKYNMILTNNNRFTKTQNNTNKQKLQKTTLWKKAYKWLNNPTKIKKFTPIIFFKNKHLEFLVIIDSYGKIQFINKNFNNIPKFKNKHLNVLLKKSQTELLPKTSKLQQLAEQLL